MGGERSASGPGRFISGKNPGAHFIGGWLGPSAGLVGLEKRKRTLTQHYYCHHQQQLPARYVNVFLKCSRAIPLLLVGRVKTIIVHSREE